LYTSPDDLPPDIDIACVVVRGALLGGTGTELALKLMKRRIHVLQEHPISHDELAECLRQARQSRVQYHLSSFYHHLQPLRAFIHAASTLLARRDALYVDAASAMQVCYALLDVLRITLGKIEPFDVTAPAPPVAIRQAAAPVRLRSLEGMFAGVPLTLRVQNQIDPANPDGSAALLHRITLGTSAGELTLASTHGPLVWTARPAIPTEVTCPHAESLFASHEAFGDDLCTALVLGPAKEVGQRRLYHSLWPDAVNRALLDMRRWISSADDPLPRGQPQLSLCRAWQKIAHELGPPEFIATVTLRDALSQDDLTSMRLVEKE
jgi:thiazolinyl imide reductase